MVGTTSKPYFQPLKANVVGRVGTLGLYKLYGANQGAPSKLIGRLPTTTSNQPSMGKP